MGVEGYLRYLGYFCVVIIRTLTYDNQLREEFKDSIIQINLHKKGTNKHKNSDKATKTFNKLINTDKITTIKEIHEVLTNKNVIKEINKIQNNKNNQIFKSPI